MWGGVNEHKETGDLAGQITDVTGTILAVGACESGETGKLYYFGPHSDVRGTLGEGPLTDQIEDALLMGTEVIIASVSESDVVGEAAAPVAGEDNTGTAVFSVTGTPLSKYELLIEILQGGAFSAATFRWSLDGGTNWSEETSVPAQSGGSVALGETGLSAVWTDTEPGEGSFVAFDTWTLTTTAPASPISSIEAVLAAIDYGAANAGFELILVAQPVATADWAALNTKANTLFQAHKPVAIICDAPWPTEEQDIDAWVETLTSAMGSFTTEYLSIFAGGAKITDQRGTSIERGGAGIYAGRLGHDPVMRSPGRVKTGALTPISELRPSGITEAHLQALDAAGFVVFRTYEGLSGYYINNGTMHPETGSPYINIERVRTAHKLIRVARAAALTKLQDEWYEDGSDASLADLENTIEGEISTRMMKGRDREMSLFQVVVPKGQDILGTEEVFAKVQFVPVGSTKKIELYFSLWKALPKE